MKEILHFLCKKYSKIGARAIAKLVNIQAIEIFILKKLLKQGWNIQKRKEKNIRLVCSLDLHTGGVPLGRTGP
jgi:hypothetical protein